MVTLPRAAHLILLALGSAIAASSAGNAQTIALVGGTVYLSPTAAPIVDAVVVASSGVITMVGKRTDVQVPPESRLIDCTGKTVVAGFWNSHIHLTEPAWKDAGNAPAEALTKHNAGNADAVGLRDRLGSRLRRSQLAGAPSPR